GATWSRASPRRRRPRPWSRRRTTESRASSRSSRAAAPRSPASRPEPLPAHLAVDQFSDEVGVAVVAGVLLDHVVVDPPEGDRFTSSHARVVEVEPGGGPAAGVAFGLPGGDVG